MLMPIWKNKQDKKLQLKECRIITGWSSVQKAKKNKYTTMLSKSYSNSYTVAQTSTRSHSCLYFLTQPMRSISSIKNFRF